MKFNTKKISIVTTLLALFSLSACGPAFLPTEFDSKNLNSQLLLKSPFTCNPRSVRTESKLKRLTKNEYVNTIIDLFPSAIISDSNVKTALDNIPEENSSLAYESFASQYDRSSIERYISTSEAISLAITQTAARQNLVFPTCFESQPMTTLCFNSFMDSFGLRAFRRPLSQIEKDIYLELYKEREATDQTLAIRGLMVSILLSPQFLYKLEFNGAPVENEENLVEIDEFELASRLSFYLWGSMPDNELYEAAKSGQLKTDEGYQRQVKRMLGHSKTTAKFKMFYSKWLKLSDIPGLTAYSQSFANGIELNTELKEDMLEEIDNLISDVVWKTNGSFSDLFATRKVYSQSQSLLKIYGVNGQNPNEFTLGQRAGLLNRAAFLVTGSDDTSPFIRGYRILEDVLCRTLPRPDQLNDFDPSLLEEPPVEAEISTRERFHRRTNSGTCMGCHSQFNPLGFALGHYD
ncbi:MAG: DUF1592 domain-containing protein [Bdellovibrionales bacterium]|nr:DUF1592 domain-containing protein [Bdellovibrionales bacterium]